MPSNPPQFTRVFTDHANSLTTDTHDESGIPDLIWKSHRFWLLIYSTWNRKVHFYFPSTVLFFTDPQTSELKNSCLQSNVISDIWPRCHYVWVPSLLLLALDIIPCNRTRPEDTSVTFFRHTAVRYLHRLWTRFQKHVFVIYIKCVSWVTINSQMLFYHSWEDRTLLARLRGATVGHTKILNTFAAVWLLWIDPSYLHAVVKQFSNWCDASILPPVAEQPGSGVHD